MPKQNHSNIIPTLQTKIHEALAPHVSASDNFALLDFPDYANVGDSAIWLGEIAYFTGRGLTPAYVCTKGDIALEELNQGFPSGTLFLHGGGNFGDLWPGHQHFREEVISRFHRHKIVQLPQSLHFSDPANLRRCAAIINAHPNFTLLVRDHKSFALAKEAFTCAVQLCPDMAFCLGALKKPVPPSHPLLLLLRTDKEKTAKANVDNSPLPAGTIIEDWLEDDPGLYQKSRQQAIFKLPGLGLRALNPYSRRELRYRVLAEARLARGLKLLASARYVITDRLHAHILCTLLGLPHTALDNSYGKISNFAEAWTKDCDLLRTELNLTAALKLYNAG